MTDTQVGPLVTCRHIIWPSDISDMFFIATVWHKSGNSEFCFFRSRFFRSKWKSGGSGIGVRRTDGTTENSQIFYRELHNSWSITLKCWAADTEWSLTRKATLSSSKDIRYYVPLSVTRKNYQTLVCVVVVGPLVCIPEEMLGLLRWSFELAELRTGVGITCADCTRL